MKNLKTCIAVLLYSSYIMSKAQRSNVNKGLGKSQSKVVNLAGLIVTSAYIVGSGPRVNSDPDKTPCRSPPG
jgi:hypothetical protein